MLQIKKAFDANERIIECCYVITQTVCAMKKMVYYFRSFNGDCLAVTMYPPQIIKTKTLQLVPIKPYNLCP